MILHKILFGTKTVYDVQENYTENIRSNGRYASWQKAILSRWIRTKEAICARFVDQFWLAEACYKQELPFVKGKAIVLENKSLHFKEVNQVTLAQKPTIRLLFSGTVAKETGIMEALELAIALHQLDKRYQLSVIGCCHQEATMREIEQLTISHKDYIHLTIKNIPIPYHEIQAAITNADIGLVCYRRQVNFRDKMPTKLFEYTTAGLPLIVQQNDTWSSFCDEFDNALLIDFQQYDPHSLHLLIQQKVFYPNGNLNAASCMWQVEEKRLLQAVTSMELAVK